MGVMYWCKGLLVIMNQMELLEGLLRESKEESSHNPVGPPLCHVHPCDQTEYWRFRWVLRETLKE